jgi:hypothetical protein
MIIELLSKGEVIFVLIMDLIDDIMIDGNLGENYLSLLCLLRNIFVDLFLYSHYYYY